MTAPAAPAPGPAPDAGAAAGATPTITRSEWLCEEIHAQRLANGLHVLVLPKPGYLKKYGILATRYGSIDRLFAGPGETEPTPVPAGIAHFLEHKLFEEEGGNAFDRFSANGAYCNAYTSYTTTAYHFACTDLFEENLKLLTDFVGSPHFTDEAIAREKEIIGQEIRMYEDSPDWRGFLNLLDCMYVRHPVKVDITGTVESIREIDRAALERCYRTFYRPSNMVLFVTGDLLPSAVFEVAARAFAGRGLKGGGGGNGGGTYDPTFEPRRILPDEPPEIAKAGARADLDVAHPRVLIGFKDPDPGYGGSKLLRKDIEVTFALDLIFGRSSEFFQRHYETGLIDQTFSATYTAEREYGHVVIGGETDEPERLHEAILTTLREARTRGFAREDFERIQRKAMGRFLRSFNSLEFIAGGFVASHFLHFDFFEYLPTLDAVRPEDLLARLDIQLDERRHAASIVVPATAAG